MEDVKKNESLDKAINRIFRLLWILVMTVGVAFFSWRAYSAAMETWDYFIHLHPGIFWGFFYWAGWVFGILLCCTLCLDSVIRNAMKYVADIKADFQAGIPESEEAFVEERAIEGAK